MAHARSRVFIHCYGTFTRACTKWLIHSRLPIDGCRLLNRLLNGVNRLSSEVVM